jgi:hypothetical protein
MARGGARTPAQPAAVSGPGAHSQRTDGGPSGTANLAAGGGTYGSRDDLEAAQSSSPVPTNREAGGGGANGPTGPTEIPSAFGPTDRPNEPITAGVAVAPGESANVEFALRALYQQFPTPYIGRLLNG